MNLLGTDSPIVAAPMAGGVTTVELARAVAAAGSFAFLAAGYKSVEVMAGEVEQLRDLPFGVNLFVPGPSDVELAAFQAYARELQQDAARLGVTLDPIPVHDDDAWDGKLAWLLEHPVPAVSLTFGLPSRTAIDALRSVGTRVLATVTTREGAVAAVASGADALIVQGGGAGGHSATFDPSRPIAKTTTAETLALVRAAVDAPLIAAGGVADRVDVQRLLQAGAEAVAVGTALLLTDEAGTSPTHRAALTDPRFTRTAVTRAFTGRPARGLFNTFMERHADAPLGYPAINHLTRDLRRAADAVGDAESMHLWAGTGWRSARTGPVSEVIAALTP